MYSCFLLVSYGSTIMCIDRAQTRILDRDVRLRTADSSHWDNQVGIDRFPIKCNSVRSGAQFTKNWLLSTINSFQKESERTAIHQEGGLQRVKHMTRSDAPKLKALFSWMEHCATASLSFSDWLIQDFCLAQPIQNIWLAFSELFQSG